MTRQVNLLRDGIEAAAAHVLRTVRVARGRQTVVVRNFGRVGVYRPAVVSDDDADCIVGTYTEDAPIEVIENDLLLRMRELSARLAANEDAE